MGTRFYFETKSNLDMGGMGAIMWDFDIRIAVFCRLDLNNQNMHIKSIRSSILSSVEVKWCLVQVEENTNTCFVFRRSVFNPSVCSGEVRTLTRSKWTWFDRQADLSDILNGFTFAQQPSIPGVGWLFIYFLQLCGCIKGNLFRIGQFDQI